MAHFRDTPSHGYFYASKTELAKMPECARRHEYEEDCEWSILVMALPECAYQLFKDPTKAINDAYEICRDDYPAIYDQLREELQLSQLPPATVENSRVLRERKFYRDHAEDFIVICAFGDWYEKMYSPGFVPKGMVGVIANRGGRKNPIKEEKYFLVTSEAYSADRTEFGFVITDEPEWTTH